MSSARNLARRRSAENGASSSGERPSTSTTDAVDNSLNEVTVESGQSKYVLHVPETSYNEIVEALKTKGSANGGSGSKQEKVDTLKYFVDNRINLLERLDFPNDDAKSPLLEAIPNLTELKK